MPEPTATPRTEARYVIRRSLATIHGRDETDRLMDEWESAARSEAQGDVAALERLTLARAIDACDNIRRPLHEEGWAAAGMRVPYAECHACLGAADAILAALRATEPQP